MDVAEAINGKLVSIHASAREATRSRCRGSGDIRCFNPRLRTGGDLTIDNVENLDSRFNPRLRTGGDQVGTA